MSVDGSALENLRRLLERDPILRDVIHTSLPTGRRRARFEPAVDVFETDEAWTLVLEVPGVPKESLSIRLDGAKLLVRGEKPAGAGAASGRRRVSERESGPFAREFLVPFQIRGDSITARLDAGVLTIVLPRTGGDRGQDISID